MAILTLQRLSRATAILTIILMTLGCGVTPTPTSTPQSEHVQLVIESEYVYKDAIWNVDETRIAACAYNGKGYGAAVYDAMMGKTLFEVLPQTPQVSLDLRCPVWSSDRQAFRLAFDDQIEQVWEINSGNKLPNSDSSYSFVTLDPTLSQNGKYRTVAQNDSDNYRYTVIVSDTETNQVILKLPQPEFIMEVVWSPDSTRLLVIATGSSGAARLYAVPSGQVLTTYAMPPSVYTVHPLWSPDGKHFALGLYDLFIWNAEQPDQPEITLDLQPGEIANGARWNADSRRLLYWTRSNTACKGNCTNSLHIYDLPRRRDYILERDRFYVVEGARWSPDEKRLLVWSAARIEVWDVAFTR